MGDDARYRTKLFIDDNITDSNITKDDDSTEASWISKFAGFNYPVTRVFFSPKNVDGMFLVDTADSTSIIDWKHEPYAYNEVTPIFVQTVTKHGITSNKLNWKMQEELRSIIETYPVPSVRSLDRMTPQLIPHGLFTIYSVQYNLKYKRANLNYTSDCTLSYGTGIIYDGDRVSGGDEGTWAETEDGTTGTFDVTTSPGSLYLNVTVCAGNEDYHVTNGTNISLSSTTYTKIRWRYKTSDTNIKAKIIIEFNDASTQEVLSDSSSTKWTVGSATITTGKTIDHIRLHADHATGSVYYDFIQIYTADFTFPNVVELNFTPPSSNPELGIPSRTPWLTQNMGAPRARIEMLCDLDMQISETTGATGNWLRTAAQKPSGLIDKNAGEVFLDVCHEHGDGTPWEWLVFGNKALKVTLDEPQYNYLEENMVRLSFSEHSNRDTSSDGYGERWNIT